VALATDRKMVFREIQNATTASFSGFDCQGWHNGCCTTNFLTLHKLDLIVNLLTKT
jgi:hypothetical protein